MEVNIYIGIWTLKRKCNQSELYGQAAFKNVRVKPRSRVRPGSRVSPKVGAG